MSDKRTNAGTPSSTSPTGDTFDAEFEKFLRDESISIEAIYRKLPSFEPGAQLDARVRALASAALRPQMRSVEGAVSPSTLRARRRWVPAFASAAVLVLAAGIAWRMGPQNWARKEAAQSVAVEANSASTQTVPLPASAPARQAGPSPTPPATAAKADRAREEDVATARPATTNSPMPFPPAKPQTAQPSAPSGSADSGATRPDAAKSEKQRSNSEQVASPPHASSPADAVRESASSIDSERASVQGELKKTQRVAPPSASSPAQVEQALDATRVAGGAARRASSPAAPPPSTQMSAPAAMQPAPGASVSAAPASTATAPVNPPRPEIAPVAPAAAPPATTFARAADEKYKRDADRGDREQRKDAEIADRPAGLSAKETTSPKIAPAPAAPPSAPVYAPEPPTPAAAAAVAAGPADRAGSDEKARSQSLPEQALRASAAPKLSFRGQPTPAQLAAWPAPRCPTEAAATSDALVSGYPPDVPATPQLRFATVQTFLDMGSLEAARKAYADFAHCSPHDRWPTYLLQQLGTR